MEKSIRISLGRQELLEFAGNEIAFYGLELDRVSTLLLSQLFQLSSNRVINICNVTSEIKALEGVGPKTRTQKESAFNEGTLLQGLYYTHFTDPRFMLKNLMAAFGYKEGGNRHLGNVIGKLFHEHKDKYADEGFAASLNHQTTIGAWERRAKKNELTGEWIISGKFREKRYYLCLAAHSEPNEIILKRAQNACAMDFQFISINV